jgi:hypothetical protein
MLRKSVVSAGLAGRMTSRPGRRQPPQMCRQQGPLGGVVPAMTTRCTTRGAGTVHPSRFGTGAAR